RRPAGARRAFRLARRSSWFAALPPWFARVREFRRASHGFSFVLLLPADRLRKLFLIRPSRRKSCFSSAERRKQCIWEALCWHHSENSWFLVFSCPCAWDGVPTPNPPEAPHL